MTHRVLILAASLLAITVMEGGTTSAQIGQDPSFRGGDMLTLAQPVVLAGPDVGFRVLRMNGQIPVGQIVVRINGAWVAADTSK
jgi:hypothetical protein